MSAPGIQRDGTLLDGSAFHSDGRWVRWDRGRPRKIGGFSQITSTMDGVVRGLDAYPDDGEIHIRMGSQSYLQALSLNPTTGIATIVTDQTPVGFATSDDNLWTFAQMYDVTSTDVYSLAHAAPNAMEIAADTTAPLYYGDIRDNSTAFAAAPSSSVSGGVAAFHPYTFIYGSDGLVTWSVAGKPTDFTNTGSGTARITAKKVVKALPVRGGAGTSPAGLFWSLDSLVRATFSGGSTVFNFDTISDAIDIIAQNSVVEYNGNFYWIGLGRFLMFNGVVRELENVMNSNFFFDNLNWAYANKIFAHIVPQFREIWWHFPMGDSTEPNHAVIYNLRYDTWYDTPLPASGRAAACNVDTFRYPLMSGVDLDASDQSILWQHEYGVDEISGGQTRAIRSYYTTGVLSAISPAEGGKPVNSTLRVTHVEPDFVQTGDMTLTLMGRAVAQGGTAETDPRTFVASPSTPAQETIGFKDAEFRQMRAMFESNVAGGDYKAGKPLALVSTGSGTHLGKVGS